MASLHNILAKDPDHQVWLDGISQACGLEQPSVGQPDGLTMDKWTRVWWFVWLFPEEGRTSKTNYGVRITQQGNKYKVLVRGPNGHGTLEYLDWFPSPGQIITLVKLVGFEWNESYS